MRVRVLFLFIILGIIFPNAFSQTADDIRLARTFYMPNDFHNHNIDTTQKEGIINKSFFALYSFYKHNISSQDNNTCAYQTSCSTYALRAINAQGVFIGIFNALDRYLRCSSDFFIYYPVDPNTGKLIDELI